jgi:hypothetical protein
MVVHEYKWNGILQKEIAENLFLDFLLGFIYLFLKLYLVDAKWGNDLEFNGIYSE